VRAAAPTRIAPTFPAVPLIACAASPSAARSPCSSSAAARRVAASVSRRSEASLHAIDRYFMQVRREIGELERGIAVASNAGRIWYCYSPYDPAMIQKLIDIHRVYYNFIQVGAGGLTRAQRFGIAKGKIHGQHLRHLPTRRSRVPDHRPLINAHYTRIHFSGDRMARKSLALLPVIAALLAGHAEAQDRDQQWNWCRLVDERGNPRPGSNPDMAIGACTTIIQSGKETTQGLAIAFISRGIAYKNNRQYDRAIQDYDQALRLDPNSAAAFNNRGNAYDDKGQHDRAIQDYDQALRLDPNRVFAFNNRGLAYKEKGQYDRAIQDFNQALRLDPSSAAAFRNRASAYRDKGQYDRAIQDFDQVVRLRPNDADVWNSRCWARALANRLPEALADCNQSLRLGADEHALDSRALVYLKMRKPDLAIADYDARLRIDPKSAHSLYGRGLARKMKAVQTGAPSDDGGASADLGAAIRINPDIAATYAKYGVPAA
jgi:tetratricopeptide (TPR) repeat protein